MGNYVAGMSASNAISCNLEKKMMTKTTICDLMIVILREVLYLVEHFNDEIILNYQLGDWGINESSIKLS